MDDMPITNFRLEWVDAEKGKVHHAMNTIVAEWGRTTKQANMVSSINGYQAYFNKKRPIKTTGGFLNMVQSGPILSPMGSTTRNINYINLTAMCIDTLTAKLASIDVVPQVNTSMANNKGKTLAKEMNYLLKGIFLKHDLSHLINDGFKRAMITRKGALILRIDDDKISFEVARLEDFITDPLNSYYSKTSKLIHRTIKPVHEVMLKYPKYKDKIKSCAQMDLSVSSSKDNTPMVIVSEGWCLNNYIKNGRHVLTINNQDIVDEEYDKDYYPIQFFDYNEPILGFTGESVTDELEPIQSELNRISQTMQHILKMVSIPRIFIDTQTDVNTEMLTNTPGEIVKYNGANGIAPIINNGAGMAPEIPQQFQNLFQLGLSRVGLTTMDTQGQQLAGTGNQSGEALKTMVDIKSERWRYLEKLYTNAHISLAKLIFKELAGKDIKIPIIDKEIGLKTLSTKLIPSTDDSYVIQIYPISAMPDNITDKMDTVERMVGLGLVSRAQMYDLFKLPDIEAEISMISAPMKVVDKLIEDMMETKKYKHPEPYYDLDYAKKTAQNWYCWSQLNKEDDSILKLLRRFINDTIGLIQERDTSMSARQALVPNSSPQSSPNQQGSQTVAAQPPSSSQPQ